MKIREELEKELESILVKFNGLSETKYIFHLIVSEKDPKPIISEGALEKAFGKGK